MMKRIVYSVILLMVSAVCFAQGVDNFNVGPYEVDYKGPSDFKYRLRPGVDLYDYFNLQRDTIVQGGSVGSAPVGGAFHLNASYSLTRYSAYSGVNMIAVDGGWKQRIGEGVYVNAGLSLGVGFFKYQDAIDVQGTLIEVGVPILLELGKPDHERASLYGGVGVVPIYFSGLKTPLDESKSGIAIAPRIEFGGYVPVDGQIVRIGIFSEWKFNSDYKDHLGQQYLGANVGLVF